MTVPKQTVLASCPVVGLDTLTKATQAEEVPSSILFKGAVRHGGQSGQQEVVGHMTSTVTESGEGMRLLPLSIIECRVPAREGAAHNTWSSHLS